MALRQVLYYTTGRADIPIHFPEDKVHCQWCSLFLRYEENFKRYSCRLTGEWILDPFHERGRLCPLIFDSKGEDSHGDSGDGAG